MLAEIYMLSVEADARSLKVPTPQGNAARFVPIELPVPPVNGPAPRHDNSRSVRSELDGRAVGLRVPEE